jgi:hypothetical protein
MGERGAELCRGQWQQVWHLRYMNALVVEGDGRAGHVELQTKSISAGADTSDCKCDTRVHLCSVFREKEARACGGRSSTSMPLSL